MATFSYLPRCLLVAVAALALAVCSSSGRGRVEGTVRYGGEPVDDGGIAFIPDGGSGPQDRATGEIHDGHYKLDGDRGPAPGHYRVEIYWNKKTGRQLASPSGKAFKDETRQAIPPRYNEQTELTADVKSGRNTLDWDLKP